MRPDGDPFTSLTVCPGQHQFGAAGTAYSVAWWSPEPDVLSLGAEAVASAVQAEARKRGQELQLIRNGSRGMYWLEPLLEVVTARVSEIVVLLVRVLKQR